MAPESRNVRPLGAKTEKPREQVREFSTDRLEHLGLDVISTRSFTSRELTDIDVNSERSERRVMKGCSKRC